MANTSTTETDNLAMMRYRDFTERRIFNNRMSLRRAMQRPDDPFPQPIHLGPNSICWRRRDVEDWIERRASSNRAAE
jgi:hypothetical protein